MSGARRFALAVGIVVGCVALAPATAGAGHGNVSGSMTGPAGFQFGGPCNGVVIDRGSGTFTATGLGSGTYSYDVCITSVSPITFTGTASLTTPRGTLSGTITGGGPDGPVFPLTITAGTDRYRKTRGTLLLGPLAQTSRSNCDPRVGICLSWIDVGPITGTLTHVPHP
jgi:hypothetical protein